MTIAKALVVDDSKVAHLTLRKMLMERSIEVDWVGSGEESLDYLKHQTPDVVFMDIMMPGMDGFETLQAINNEAAITKPRVVMCSANTTSEDRSLADQHGAVAFLTKPYTSRELDQLLQELSAAEPAVAAPIEIPAPAEEPAPAFREESLEPTEQIRIPEFEPSEAPASEPDPLTLEPAPEQEPLPAPSPEPATPGEAAVPSAGAPAAGAPATDLPDRAALEAMMHEIAESVTRKNAEITLYAARQASTRVAESVAHRVVEEMLQHRSDRNPDTAVDPEQLRQSLQQSLSQHLDVRLEEQVGLALDQAFSSEDFGQRLDQRIKGIAQASTEVQTRDIAQKVVRDALAEQQMDDTADRALGRSGSAMTVGGLALALALAALALTGGSWLGLL